MSPIVKISSALELLWPLGRYSIVFEFKYVSVDAARLSTTSLLAATVKGRRDLSAQNDVNKSQRSIERWDLITSSFHSRC